MKYRNVPYRKGKVKHDNAHDVQSEDECEKKIRFLFLITQRILCRIHYRKW